MQPNPSNVSSPSELDPPEDYSIRRNTSPGRTCAMCQIKPTWEGPVGYRGSEPICDICLLVGSPDLGLLLALGILARAFAADSHDASAAERAAGLDLLAIFALVFDRKSTWPRRNEFSDDFLIQEVFAKHDRDPH